MPLCKTNSIMLLMVTRATNRFFVFFSICISLIDFIRNLTYNTFASCRTVPADAETPRHNILKTETMLKNNSGEGSKMIRLRNRNLQLFCVFFIIYVFLGMCISYRVSYDANILFGADNRRALLDLTDITYSHYRIKVHPLFLILTQPIVLIVNGFVNNSRLSVILVESFAGALSVVFLHNILKQLCSNEKLSHIISCMYGLSFSMMIFSSIPESFVFAALGLVCFWYFVLRAAYSDEKNEKIIYIIFVILGVISFGITLTNYLPYCLGLLFYLIVREEKAKAIIKKFVLINLINSGSIIILCVIQKMVWSQCPIFLESIIHALLGHGYEETYYMNWLVNLDKTVGWLKEIFARSIISPDIYMQISGKYYQVSFGGYGVIAKIMLIAFFVCFAALLILMFIRLFRNKDKKKSLYIAMLIVSFACNALLHYFYGAHEAFIYTPHYLFILFILLAAGVNSITSPKIAKAVYGFFVVFCAFELINNIYYGIKTAEIALDYAGMSPILWPKVALGTFLCALLCFVICYLLERYELKTGKPIFVLGTGDEFKAAIRSVAVFGILTLLCCMFISFNYNGVYGFLKWCWHIIIKIKGKLLGL